MLNMRVLTAAILIMVIASGVLLLPSIWAAFVLAIPMFIGMIEWTKLAGLDKQQQFVVTALSVAISIFTLWTLLNHILPIHWILNIAVLWWLINAWDINISQKINVSTSPSITTAMLGLFILTTTWCSVIWLHTQPYGPWLLLFLLSLIWVADSGAYFAGKRWGRTKLAPVLSPNKTMEGVYGAFISTLPLGIILATMFGTDIIQQIYLMLMCLFTVGASIVGDLYESKLKRKRNLKDSGALLPGHGGMLDRIDSLTAAAPVFVLGLIILGVI
ncbi:hypothetical protein TI04_06520 [Achromatium sp. WMS2]|nr:hypothetical protein TI04_06520 [Achromatium sp. WMS2]